MAGRAPQTLTAPAAGRARHRILIIEARFYETIADELAHGATAELDAAGATYDRVAVPGALEIPQALAQTVAAGLIPASGPSGRYSGAVALGCVIRGETSHYEIVCTNANYWLMEIAIRNNVPVGNGILTVENEQQALARAQGGRDSKGAEAARACLRLIEIARQFQGQGA
jgi:6,7-dimethyl-8-ribityllumazine synthase